MARTLGVICARGGSKGFPGKNLALVNNKRMIDISMTEAFQSRLLTRWIVSTDSQDIADIANAPYMKKGHAPFLRPEELAQDDSRIEGALQHALEYCEEEEGERYDYICMLLNTHPLRTSEDIDGCINMLDHMGKECTAAKSGYWIVHPYELYIKDGNGFLVLDRYADSYQRQGMEREMFKGNGAVVVTKRETLMERDSIWGNRLALYEMPMYRSQDVDSPEDLEACEIILRGMRECAVSSAEVVTSC